MKTLIKMFTFSIMMLLVACGGAKNPDAVPSHQTGDTVSDCVTKCHSSAISASLDPTTINGTGTSGKHLAHVQSRNIGCEKCHLSYIKKQTHMNGRFDTTDPAVQLMNFDLKGPTGTWTNDTGAQTGSCSLVACHGPDTLDWYGTAGWTMPACTTCHTGSLDPLGTNGQGTAGKHVVHVQNRGIDCTVCHLNYTNIITHMNGNLDTTNPAATLVHFDSSNPNAQWINDTSPQTGSCSSVSCHGTNTLDWYGTTGWTMPACTTCHTGPLDPSATNGSGTAGKHVKHVQERGIDCTVCHLDYVAKTTHMNGTLNTTNPAASLVHFNSSNPNGVWINDTGPQTGSCSSVACHGPNTVDWYGAAGWTMPACTTCHTGPLDPSAMNGTGTAGKHVKHVQERGIDCTVCHLDYITKTSHMNGILDTAYNDIFPDGTPNTSISTRIVYFDSSNPNGKWINDTGPQTGSCSSVTCHGTDTLNWYGTTGWTMPACTTCHTGPLDPSATNGSGTAGKHVKHVQERGIDCTVCHLDYMAKTTHMNGTLNTTNPAASLVHFNSSNPNGAWINDTGPQTGSCSSVSCHGTNTLDWYGTTGWTMPACATCHTGPLDPSATNGSGTAGKHVKHAQERGIDCTVCHLDYITKTTHMNGQFDTINLAVRMIYFDSSNPNGAWINDAGPQTGSCSSVACHGPSTVDWYGAAGWTMPACATCHTGPLDPSATNSSGTAGKHVKHVQERGIDCTVCHLDYVAKTTHMNGTLNTTNPAATLVHFNSLNPNGAWINDTGPQAGSCSSVSCHGTNTLDWYGTTGWTMPACTTCHTGPLDPSATNGSGTTGKHIKHVSERGIACVTCHFDYITKSTHMSGQLDTPNPAVQIVNFNSSNPNGKWLNDTGPRTGSCSSVSCHGPDTLYWYGTTEWTMPACTACHIGQLDPSETNGSGTAGKHVVHVQKRNIPCEKCHLYYMTEATHMNGQLDTLNSGVQIVNFDPINSNGRWDKGIGSCTSLACHGTDALDWYGTAGWTLPSCLLCHAEATATRRQVLGAGGDFNKESHHVINYDNRTSEIVTDGDCKVCHDMDSHMSGTIRLKDKDNADQVIVYNPANVSSLEPFCLSCHDDDGAITESNHLKPFNGSDPNTLGSIPNKAGTQIKSYWNKAAGHGKKGLTCLGDGRTRGTGCHGDYNSGTGSGSINAHGSGNEGLLSNKLTMTIPATNNPILEDSNYTLCLDCHKQDTSVLTLAQLVGVADGGNYAQPDPNNYQSTHIPYTVDFMSTRFHDYGNNDQDTQLNLHLFHLTQWVGGWSYRGVIKYDANGKTGLPSCVTCHNVHGVDGQTYLWDEWNFSIRNGSGVEYGFPSHYMGNNTYPENCTAYCHMYLSNFMYPRSQFNEAKARAITSNPTKLLNGDTVIIYFSDSIGGPPSLNASNINSVLALSGGHRWPSQLTAEWSSANGKSNNVLTITIGDISSTIAVGDSITFDLSTIKDAYGNPIRGKMTLKRGA